MLNSFCYDDDDDEDYTITITPNEPVLSTEEPDNSLSMGDEHLDTIPATESDEIIKSSVENLILIPSESEGISEHMCDVPFHDNSLPHSDSPLYASFIFDLSINPFPPADRSDFYEFIDKLIHFISPLEYDCFLFKVEPNSRDFTKDVVEDISPTKEPKVHHGLHTHPTL
nr:hypothetical protein [Tanacetum cinerariifolium]